MQVIPFWLRAVVACLLVTIIFFSGWNVRAHKADADIAALKLAQERASREADDAARAKLAELDAASREAAARLSEELKRQRGASTVIRKEISHEKTAAAVAGSVRFLPLVWVRLYDASLGGPLDPAEAGPVAAGAPGRAGVPDSEPSTVSEWDVLENHADNAERWARCRAGLNALIDALSASQAVVTSNSESREGQ